MPDNLHPERDIARGHGEPDVARPADTQTEVAAGLGEPAAAHLVEDPYIGVRADHHQPAPRPLTPEQASASAEDGSIDVGSEVQDAQVVPAGPSVWEAVGDDED